MSTLHNGRYRWILKLAVVGGGIHFLHRRGKDIISTAILQQTTVGIEGAGIVLKVVLVIELSGVDKYRYHGNVIVGHTTSYQRGMTLMECSHSGNKTNRLTFFASIE